VIHAGNQKITNKEQSPRVGELRGELRRKIAAHAPRAGAHATAIPGLTLYHRTAPSPCYPAMFEPSLNVFVQGRKRIAFAGTTYLCDESTFLLSSIDVPVASQIVAASEDVPLLSLLLKLDMAVVREILSREESPAPDGSSPARGIAIGKTTVDLLQPFCRLLDLLDASEDIPFLSNLIQREIVYRLLRGPQGERLRDRHAGRSESQNSESDCLAQGQLHKTCACRETCGNCTHGNVNPSSSLPRVDGDEPTAISETASISCRARTNACGRARCRERGVRGRL